MDIILANLSREELEDLVIKTMDERNDYARKLLDELNEHLKTMKKLRALTNFAKAVSPLVDDEVFCELLEKFGCVDVD